MDIIDGLTRKLWQLRKPSEGMSDDERTKQTKQAELSSIKMAMKQKIIGMMHSTIQSIWLCRPKSTYQDLHS